MRKIIVSIVLIALFAGCGSKKKISNISKGYEVILEESKNDTKTEEAKVTKGTVKEKEVVKETYDRETVLEYIFDSSGRVTSAKQTVKEKGQKDTNRDIEASKTDSATNTATSTTAATKSTDKGTHTEAKETERTAKNPIWHWIGFGLFVVILGGAVVAYFRVRR